MDHGEFRSGITWARSRAQRVRNVDQRAYRRLDLEAVSGDTAYVPAAISQRTYSIRSARPTPRQSCSCARLLLDELNSLSRSRWWRTRSGCLPERLVFWLIYAGSVALTTCLVNDR